MSWTMSFETKSHEDLRTHAAAYAKGLRDPHQADQVPHLVDRAVELADVLGATNYAVTLAGHAAGEDASAGDSLSVTVTRRADDPPVKA